MRRVILLAGLIGILALTGCKSGSIAFKEGMAQQSFNAELFVPFAGVATIDYSGMNIIAEEGFKTMYKDHIEEIYLPVKIERIAERLWKNNPPEINQRITLKTNNITFADKESLALEEQDDKSDRALDYDYSSIEGKMKGPYLFEYRIVTWGYHPMYNNALLEYQATLVNMETEEIEWRTADKIMEQYDLGFTGDADDITQDMVEDMMGQLISQSFQDIQDELIKTK